MPKKVDHEDRKNTILYTALQVFAEEGYRDSNLSLIAERCGLSRPTLYQYFKNKEEIYYYAVKLVTGKLFTKYAAIAFDGTIDNPIDRIVVICEDIINVAKQNEAELQSLMDVMLQMRRDNLDFSKVIMKRTAKLSLLLKRLLRRSVKEGYAKPCDIEKTAGHLFTLLEAFCFQIAFLGNFDLEESKNFITTYLEFIKI